MSKLYKYINLDYLNEISSNVDFKRKIFAMFKKEIASIEEQMKTALKSNHTNYLAELAHKAKSSVSVLGMQEMAAEMKSLELDIKNNANENSYKSRIDHFIETCKLAVKEINQIEEEL